MNTKKGLSLKEHFEIGSLLKEMSATLSKVITQITNAFPLYKTKSIRTKFYMMEDGIHDARCYMENILWDEYGLLDMIDKREITTHDGFAFYYGAAIPARKGEDVYRKFMQEQEELRRPHRAFPYQHFLDYNTPDPKRKGRRRKSGLSLKEHAYVGAILKEMEATTSQIHQKILHAYPKQTRNFKDAKVGIRKAMDAFAPAKSRLTCLLNYDHNFTHVALNIGQTADYPHLDAYTLDFFDSVYLLKDVSPRDSSEIVHIDRDGNLFPHYYSYKLTLSFWKEVGIDFTKKRKI